MSEGMGIMNSQITHSRQRAKAKELVEEANKYEGREKKNQIDVVV